MPFEFIEIDDADNGSEKLPAGLSPEDLQKLIATAVAEKVTALVTEALRPHLFALTGNMDHLPGTKR